MPVNTSSEPNPSVSDSTRETSPVLTADQELDLKIAEQESKIRYWETRVNIGPLLISLIGIFVFLFFAFFGRQVFEATSLARFGHNSLLMGFFFGVYFLLIAVIQWMVGQFRVAALRQELDEWNAKRRILSKLPSESYFDSLVNINVTNLGAYYGLVKAHTNNSFLVSIAAGLVGFLLIIIGLMFGFAGTGHEQTLAYLSAGSGIVTEFISGVFFYLYNQTVRQLKEYHDSLLEVQNILLSFKIVESTQDQERRIL